MERGYVKLWRKTLDSGLLQNATVLQVFIYLLLNTTHKPYRQMVGSSVVDLVPGQIVTGRKAIAKECQLSEQNVRTALKILENLKILTIQPTNKYSIVSFVNWDTYQQEQPATQPASQPSSNQQVTSSQPAGNQQLTTNKNKEQRTKNKKENTYCASAGDAPQAQDELVQGSAAWKRKKRAESFELFWDAFAYKRGRGGAEKAWNAIPRLTDELMEKILEAARKEAAQRKLLIEAGRTPKMAQGWISERRWEDEYESQTVQPLQQQQHKSFAEMEEERNREEFLRLVRERKEREAANG